MRSANRVRAGLMPGQFALGVRVTSLICWASILLTAPACLDPSVTGPVCFVDAVVALRFGCP